MSAARSDGWSADWVRTRDIPTIAERIRVIREGTSNDDGDGGAKPDPVGAMRLLAAFARHRKIKDLLELRPDAEGSGGFAPLDAAVVLNLAALTRPVEEAARLAIEQWRMESQRPAASSRVTDSIVHDVTAQRIVPEVAAFITEFRRNGREELVSKTLNAFVDISSGRTSFDKALLHLALCAADCTDQAAELLLLALHQAGADASVHPAAGQAGIIAALHHLNPAEKIAEAWIERQMEEADESDTIELVASLLIGERDSDRELARHAGCNWRPYRLIDLCETLARRARGRPGRLAIRGRSTPDSDDLASRAQARLSLVRGYAATRPEKDDLAEIISRWYESSELTGTLTDLLADIVAGGADSIAPHPIEFIDALHKRLKRRVPPRCHNELYVAAAVHVRGREAGAEVAEFLGRVGRGGGLRRAAEAVNERLTAPLRASASWPSREAAVSRFVDYVNRLKNLPKGSALTFWALRALSDPGTADPVPEGRVVADIAVRLYAEVRADIGFDLLERFLENEQWLSRHDAASIFSRVKSHAMHDDRRWYPLLSATVGRWADTDRRDSVVAEVRRMSCHADADAIIHSVQ